MKVRADELEVYAAGAAVLLVLGLVVFVAVKGFKGAAQSVVNAATDTAAGVVVGVGQAVGLPDPATPAAKDKCAACIAAGDMWGASLNCPAGTFIKAVFSGSSAAPAPDAAANDGTLAPDGDSVDDGFAVPDMMLAP